VRLEAEIVLLRHHECASARTLEAEADGGGPTSGSIGCFRRC
jgi:hypothetical protein